jgi:CRP-like cAMP-binding protein
MAYRRRRGPADGGSPGLPRARNRLLATLPRDTAAALERVLEPLDLLQGQVLHRAGHPIQSVYFPDGALISLVANDGDERTVEVATVGNEGFLGLPVVLGGPATPAPFTATCQVAGPARRGSAGELCAVVRGSVALQSLLLRYALAFTIHAAQGVACNRLHDTRQRLTCWLLLAHDRIGLDEIVLTQQVLAMMLGVRRATVGEVAGALQRAGAIAYRRGQVSVVDRARLEGTACGCYRIVRGAFDATL